MINRETLVTSHREWVEAALASEESQRIDVWTKSLAVGSQKFVLETQDILGAGGRGRDILRVGASFVLREHQEVYGGSFSPGNRPIASDNTHLWNVFI